MREIFVDGFCGGGGASTGIKWATGRSPDIAINHDEAAIAMHTANHPETEHYCQNIWRAVPSEVLRTLAKKLKTTVAMLKIGLAWFSPDCKHFSKAKGAVPVKKNIRDLAWVVIAWAKLPKRHRPRIIMVENVEEFVTWGPLDETGRPCIKRGGQTFRRWVKELRRLGYVVDWREIVAADHGAPTKRNRLYVIARNDGLPIVWPEHSHGKPDLLPVRAGKMKPWRTAAECIDWSIPCPSIFDTAEEIMTKYGVRAIRPLAENTLNRIARGIGRYVLNTDDPYIVAYGQRYDRGDGTQCTPVGVFTAPVTHTGDSRVHGLDEPTRTITTAQRGETALITPFLSRQFGASVGASVDAPAPTAMPNGGGKTAIVIPTLIQSGYGERKGQAPRILDLQKPLGTCVDGRKHALVAAFLAQHNTDMVGHDVRKPLSTIVQKGCTQAVVSAGLVNLKGTDRRQGAIDEPAPTQTAGGWHIAEVQAFLLKYYGTDQAPNLREPMHTQTTEERFALCTVMIGGEPYVIVDIGMRMLTPRELFRAQGFLDSYIIDHGYFRDEGALPGVVNWRPLTKTQQIRMCGNSVCPDVAAALVGANYTERSTEGESEPAFALTGA